MDVRKRIAKYLKSPSSNLMNGKTELSYSRLSTMARSPYEHYLRYEKHWQYYKEKSFFWFGKNVHQVLDFFYGNGMESNKDELIDYWEQSALGSFQSNDRPIEFGDKEIQDAVGKDLLQDLSKSLVENEITNEEYIQYIDDMTLKDRIEYGKEVISGYYDEYAEQDRKRWKVLGTEKPFWIPLLNSSGRINQKYVLVGIIDLLVYDKELKKVLVIDHKTLSRKMDESTPETSYQITLYMLGSVYWGEFSNAGMFNCLYKNKTPKYERLITERTNDDMLEFIDDVNSISKAISYGIKHKNLSMGMYMTDFKEYILTGSTDKIVPRSHKALSEIMSDRI